MSIIRLITNKPVAYDSPDHVEPWGTIRDNSTHPQFNYKLSRYITVPQLRVLDLGCAGGGFVKSILDIGGVAVGVEGSDHSKRIKRAEWATIPGNLFTADITVPFQIEVEPGQQRLLFSVVTAWELFEHIAEEQLKSVVDNILKHLAPHGIVLVSVAPFEDVRNGVQLHQTVENQDWWVAKFLELGLQRQQNLETYFGRDWVRGPDVGSFNLAMTRVGKNVPNAIKLTRLLWEERINVFASRVVRRTKRIFTTR